MRQAHHLGVDIGGTKVAFRAEAGGRCVDESSFRWDPRHSAERDLERLARHVGELRGRLAGPLRAVGVAMPGTVGPDGRVTAWPSRPEWNGLDLDGALRALFPGAATARADDGDLGALAEARVSGCEDLLYLGVGTGIGGGFVLRGGLCPGPDRGSFELGHVIVELDGAPCLCGRRGCLQALASGPATLDRAALLRGAPVAFEELVRGLDEGRSWAVAAVDRTSRALAAAVSGVQELLHPRLVVVGGGFAAGVPGIVTGVGAHLAALSRPGQSPPAVRPAALGGLSSLHGALALARLTAP
ncbi:ROK family protein [Streptomyces sp. NPDC093801]|uniref:ROK family protein n=1 Tax=Streptomyces sp. NPDC093801 TaxID=3155203 RepID=UPI00344B4555